MAKRPTWPRYRDPDAWPVGTIRKCGPHRYEVQGVNGRYVVDTQHRSCTCLWGRLHWRPECKPCWHRAAVGELREARRMEQLIQAVRKALSEGTAITIGTRQYLAVPDQDVLELLKLVREIENQLKRKD